eukprot:6187529-Pleurochrysis_carterae.AAC.1
MRRLAQLYRRKRSATRRRKNRLNASKLRNHRSTLVQANRIQIGRWDLTQLNHAHLSWRVP